MRVEAGPHVVTTTDGTELHVDQPLSREQADVLIGLLRQHDTTPAEVCAIEFSEGGITIEGPPTQ